MSVKASDLSKSGAKGKALDDFVREQLIILDERLQKSDRTWGTNVVEYDLPTVLNLPGLAQIDSQKILYVTIIKGLKDRGFTVRLSLTKARSTLFVEWVTDIEEAEVVVIFPLHVAVGVVLRDTRIEAHSAGGVVEAEAVMVAAETTTEVLEGGGVTMEV